MTQRVMMTTKVKLLSCEHFNTEGRLDCDEEAEFVIKETYSHIGHGKHYIRREFLCQEHFFQKHPESNLG